MTKVEIEDWRLVHSTERPTEIDITSSTKYVYIRRNPVLQHINIENTDIDEWQYEELKLTLEEYYRSPYFNRERQLLQQVISDQELTIVENELITTATIQDLAQQISELELTVVENSINE